MLSVGVSENISFQNMSEEWTSNQTDFSNDCETKSVGI